MAEKKFFVDINLQGNKLANSVVGANSSMTTGGSFRYAEGRLEYFDGATVQEVANLADISAVTGGLIFQGGYNAATDTPDITDGTALKGYFWAVSTAGSFLGESVQVGDSLVAKVDNAGESINDWLILQGNIVTATDSVEGISRLATQTEANDGTEGGAVVITPATLQGKIDAQITPTISSKLPLAGGTMSGNIDLGTYNLENAGAVIVGDLAGLYNDTISVVSNLDLGGNGILNVPAPTNGGDAANKLYVDEQDGLNLSLSGGTMSGNINMDGNSILDIGTAYVNNLNSADFTSPINLDVNIDAGTETTIINLPAPTNGGDATNKTYVDGAASTAQANAEAYADGLAVNYDAAGSAATAQANAEAYADSLAPNYDAAGSAAQALTDANAYTDTGLSAKLNLAGGTMSGGIDMAENTIDNVSVLKANDFYTNGIASKAVGGEVYLLSPVNANGNNIGFLPAPTADGDAANKLYVDTEIAKLNNVFVIETTDWTLVNGSYQATLLHGVTAGSVSAQFMDLTDDEYVEFAYFTSPIYITVKSNFIPNEAIRVLAYGAN